MTKHVSTGPSGPTANVAVNRNRLKHYGDRVYLKDGVNFEIELFNPKSTKVLAKIYLNGRAISTSGIVLRPGERVYLERWLDEPKKFLFETYRVEDSPETKAAIEDNGRVKVEFYDEVYYGSAWTTRTVTTYEPTPFWYYGSTYTGAGFGMTGSSGPSGPPGLSSTTNVSAMSSSNATFAMNASIETGRVESGGSSQQVFSTDHSSYSQWMSSSIEILLLPESHKPVDEIRHYCTGCGARKKKDGWKFCPTCGAGF